MLDDYVLDNSADDMTCQVEGDSRNQELPDIPDMDPSEETGFTVKIQAPGTETTDFQVKSCLYLHELKRIFVLILLTIINLNSC